MIKRIMLALIVVLTSFFVLTVVPQAHARPYGINCSGTCSSAQTWGSNTSQEGSSTSTTVDNPNGSGFVDYAKYLWDNFGSGGSYAEVGEFNNTGPCAGLGYGYVVYDSVINRIIGQNCFSINSGDLNYPHTTTYAADFWGGNANNEIDIWINGTATGDNPCTPCKLYDGDFNTYTTFEQYQIQIKDSNITTHIVWGGQWIQNKWLSGHTWNYDQTDGNQLIDGSGQPEVFWSYGEDPKNSTTGGVLDSCVYPNSNGCVLGS